MDNLHPPGPDTKKQRATVVGGQIDGQPTGLAIVAIPDKSRPKGFTLRFTPQDDLSAKQLRTLRRIVAATRRTK